MGGGTPTSWGCPVPEAGRRGRVRRGLLGPARSVFVSGRALCPPPARGQGSWERGRSVCSAGSAGRKADVTCYAILTVTESRGTPHHGTFSFPGTPGSESRRLPAAGILAGVEAGRAAPGLHSWAGPGGRSGCVHSVVAADGGWPDASLNCVLGVEDIRSGTRSRLKPDFLGSCT